MYQNGEEQNFAEALNGIEGAKNHSQYNLGYMYQDGNGVQQSYDEALKWYMLSIFMESICFRLYVSKW